MGEFSDGSYALYTLYNDLSAKFDTVWVNNCTEHVRDLMVLVRHTSFKLFGVPQCSVDINRVVCSRRLLRHFLHSHISSLLASDITPIYRSAIHALQADSTNYDPSLEEYINSLPSVSSTTYRLWFCGLGTSLASAVLAMLLQSWVRRYTVMTHPRGGALIRAYMILDGPLKSLQLIMDFLHLLLDTSIFTFLAGLLVLLTSTSQDSGNLFLVGYISIPLFLSYLKVSFTSFLCPTIYTTPLSRVIRHGIQFLSLTFQPYTFPLKSPLRHRPNEFLGFDWVMLGCVDQVAEKLIETQDPRSLLDGEIVAWLLRSVRDDQDLERFLECIPGFYDSDQVEQPSQVFRPLHRDRIPRSILSLMSYSVFRYIARGY